MSDDDDTTRAPMTIKAMRVSTRRAIGDAARRADMAIADWLEEAALAHIAREGQVLAPKFEVTPPAIRNLASTADTAALLQAVAALAGTSEYLPAGLRKSAEATANACLKAARGLVPKGKQTGLPKQQTALENGQTDRLALQ